MSRPRFCPTSMRDVSISAACIIALSVFGGDDWLFARTLKPRKVPRHSKRRRTRTNRRQQPDEAPPQQPAQEKDKTQPPATKPNPDPQTPVKIDATVDVFGAAEPQKTDISRDVRSLPVHSSLLQEVEIRRRTFREPAEMLRSLPGVDFVYYGQGGIPSGPAVRGYTDRNSARTCPAMSMASR